MTEDEMMDHPAYLLAMNHACAVADVHAIPSRMEHEPEHYDRHSHNAKQAAFAIGRDLRAEVEAAQKRCEAAGHSFAVDGRLIPAGNGLH